MTGLDEYVWGLQLELDAAENKSYTRRRLTAGSPTAVTHFGRKMIWTKPPWNYVPAVNLQGCTPFIKVAYLSPLYIFGNKATDGTKLDLNIGDTRVWRLDSGPNLQPCSLVASPFRSSEHLWGDGVHGLSGVCMRLQHFVADTSNETNPGCLGDL